jgi:hypothetical protein
MLMQCHGSSNDETWGPRRESLSVFSPKVDYTSLGSSTVARGGKHDDDLLRCVDGGNSIPSTCFMIVFCPDSRTEDLHVVVGRVTFCPLPWCPTFPSHGIAPTYLSCPV